MRDWSATNGEFQNSSPIFPWQQIQNQSTWLIWYYDLPPLGLLFGQILVRLSAHGVV